METNKVKEVNVDNVIPFDKPKSGLSIRQENLMNETLILINQYLTRINKFSIKELYSWVIDDLFDDFYIGEEKNNELTTCCFGYSDGKYSKKGLGIIILPMEPVGVGFEKVEVRQSVTCSFQKGDLRNDMSRKKISIWITKHIFSYYGTEEELEEFFCRSVFSKENNIILYK